MVQMAPEMTIPKFATETAVATTSGVLCDILVILAQENIARVTRATKLAGLYRSAGIVECFYALADALGVPCQAKHLAICLFERFMMVHVGHVDETRARMMSAQAPTTVQEELETTLFEHLPLRVLTCIQIASKVESHYHAVRVQEIRALLRKSGRLFSATAILKSELRVLNTLDYRTNIASPVLFLEILLRILKIRDKALPVDELFPTCISFVDLVVLRREEFYALYYLTETGRTDYAQRRGDVAHVQEDYILLAAGVIVAAASISCSDAEAKMVHALMADISKIEASKLTLFLTTILRFVVTLKASAVEPRDGPPAQSQ